MGRSRVLVAAIVVLATAAVVPSAWGATGSQSGFRPRIGGALGLVPAHNQQSLPAAGDVASGALTPVTYHGGPVMSGGVTVHTIFWAPAGFAFQGSPGAGIPTYEGLIQQFFTDVAADSGASGTCTPSDCNSFTIERQYAQGTSPGQITPGSYAISYSTATDSIDATDAYPSKSSQCASPVGADVCLTDDQVTSEVDDVVQTTGGGRGLHNLWFVFLPPGVDECIGPGDCGSNTFAGYHAVSNVSGHGATIYAVAIDPIIEGVVSSGADPEGYPDAEVTLVTAGHETNEAITDPEGNGWMDPNGFEVGDKCESGPQIGNPLGFAADGSPYNQVINGHKYLLQEEWANVDSAGNDDCVQATTTTTNQLPLPQVDLTQFNPGVSGNVDRVPGGGIHVQVSLVRANPAGNPVVVASASTTTRADGSWWVWLWPHAPGDDRDEIDIDYSGPNAPQPGHQVILTGNGGNPFTEAGWTGWLAMDNASAISASGADDSLSLAPCFQAGTLSFSFDGAGAAESPNDLCNTETDVATETIPTVDKGDAVTWTSNDNRAFDAPTSPSPNLLGGLVSLTVPVGEPGSVSDFTSALPTFTQGGFPSCTADLELLAVQCTGLVPGERYTVSDRHDRASGEADGTGTLVAPLLVRRGELVKLSNGSRTLTTLHVANLRAKILGEETFLSGGTCQAGEYYGTPLSQVPSSAAAGLPSPLTTGGVALTGEICPRNGHAAGLPDTTIAQTDERSGGQTETEVPDIVDTSPIDGEAMYGRFTALAESGLTLSDNEFIPTDAVTRISLQILTPRGATVVKVRNVDTAQGVSVAALRPGSYIAVWTLTDLNGDTRTAATRFIEEVGRAGSGPKANVAVRFAGASGIAGTVTFPGERQLGGSVSIRLSRGDSIVALGHAHVRKGRATLTMRALRSVASGRWRATLVLSRPHFEPVTIQAVVRAVG
jgi:hypothetical protein